MILVCAGPWTKTLPFGIVVAGKNDKKAPNTSKMGCGGSKGARHLPIRLGLEGEGVTIRLVDIQAVPDVDAHNLLGAS